MSIARHSAYNLAGSIVPIVAGLVTVPLYLSHVGLERFGVFTIAWLLLGQLDFLNLGMGPALAQKLANERDAPAERRSTLFWTALGLNLAMGVVGAAMLLALGSWYFGSMEGLPAEVRREIGPAIFWLALLVPFSMLNSVLNGALQGRERFLAQNLIGGLGTTLITVLPLVAAFAFGPRLEVLLAAALAGRLISLLLQFLVCLRAVPLAWPRLETGQLKPLLAFGGWMTVTSLVAPLVVTVDRYVIGALIGAAAVSVYVVPYMIAERLRVIPQSLANALFPRFSYSAGEERDRLLVDSVAALSAVITPAAVLAIAALGPFLQLWVGDGLAAEAAPIGYILVAGFWANSFARIPFTLLIAKGRPDLVAKLLLGYLLPYLVLLVLCLSWYGLIGAAIAWTIKALFDPLTLFLMTRQARRVLPPLLLPGAAVATATGVALALPLESLLRWGLLAFLLLVVSIFALKTAPDVLKVWLSRLPLLGAAKPATPMGGGSAA